MIVLSNKSTDEVRNEIFERINRGSDLLQAMEKRKGIYKGVFSNFIYEVCAKNELFNKLTRIDSRQNKRQEKEELILRFFALKDNFNNFPKNQGIASFLDKYIDNQNKKFDYLKDKKIFEYIEIDKKLHEYYDDFTQMLNVIERYFEYGFSKNSLPQVSRIYFEALSVGVHLALKDNPNFTTSRERVKKWINSNEFKATISGKYHTHIPQRIKQRIFFVKDNLLKND